MECFIQMWHNINLFIKFNIPAIPHRVPKQFWSICPWLGLALKIWHPKYWETGIHITHHTSTKQERRGAVKNRALVYSTNPVGTFPAFNHSNRVEIMSDGIQRWNNVKSTLNTDTEVHKILKNQHWARPDVEGHWKTTLQYHCFIVSSWNITVI